MKMLAVILTICLASKCWSIPADFTEKEARPVKTENKSEEMVDTELDDAIKSLTMAASMLKDDPTYMKLENDFEHAMQDSILASRNVPEPKVYPSIISEQFPPSGPSPQDFIQLMQEDPGLEIEYDTTRLVLKNKKPHKEHHHRKIFMKHYDQLVPAPENIFGQQQQQTQENFFNKQQQEEENERQMQRLPGDNLFTQQQPQIHNCDVKCEDTLTPVCGINVHGKYAIFENICDMKVSVCLNPDLDWQPLPREMCKEALHSFYMRLHRYFTETTEPENLLNTIRK